MNGSETCLFLLQEERKQVGEGNLTQLLARSRMSPLPSDELAFLAPAIRPFCLVPDIYISYPSSSQHYCFSFSTPPLGFRMLGAFRDPGRGFLGHQLQSCKYDTSLMVSNRAAYTSWKYGHQLYSEQYCRKSTIAEHD
jgi:hypothetical protein